jgi:hypothetical protein
MKCGNEMSPWELFLEGMQLLGSPALEAAKLQSQMKACTLEETVAAAERSGCAVTYADLPEKVSGFAETIEGQPYIVLNRTKPRMDLEYTLPHELGHHVVKDSVEGLEELGANLFAVAWITSSGNERRDEVLQNNAEAFIAMLTCLIGTLVLALVALLVYFNSKFAPAHPALPQAK